MIHLDTNFLVASLRPGSPQQIQTDTWLLADEELSVSTVAWAEFLCGPLTSNDELLARQMFPAPEPLVAADANWPHGCST